MTTENNSSESCSKDHDIEKDQRQMNLLNDPNYGIVLCFLAKFRSILDLPNYPLQRFEDHLLNSREQTRLIDFHFILLKRLSFAKNAQRDKFDSIISKFTSRFDLNDSHHITTTGYLQAEINIKIRIIKNLLEYQLDLNQTLKNTLINKSAGEIKSSALGRDRFGASYWLFMDSDCFVRLFREDIDEDRTWSCVAKDQDELEKFIKLLITDCVLRNKFSDWTIDYEPFASLPPSNEFEKCYVPVAVNIKEEEEEVESIPDDMEDSDVSMKKKRGRPRGSKKSKIDEQVKTPACGARKRKLMVEENNHDEDESSIDDVSLAIRRSSRSRKAPTMEPVSAVTSTTISPIPEAKKRHSINGKTKVSNKLSSTSRRKTICRRNIDDSLCLSTSSSDEHMNYSSSDDYNSDDYLPNQSQIDMDDNLFEFDEDTNTNNEQLRPAKTAEASTIITTCYICSKSDRPEVLLLCDGCNDAYHLECLRPILLSIPDGDWYCPLCEHKNLSNNLIKKFKEFQFSKTDKEPTSKNSLQSKIKINDETSSVSESEQDDESLLSTSQINENSNLSSSYFDDKKPIDSISQRGRHRRTRFDINQILSNSDDYLEKTDFDLQLPNKITRLIRHQSSIKTEQRTKSKAFLTRLCEPSLDLDDMTGLNEKLGSPLVYVNCDENSRQIKSAITNSKQTLKIVRRWNDVQRRSRLKATAVDCTDEQSILSHEDASSLRSNDSNSEIKDDDSTIIHSKLTADPIDWYSSRNIVKKSDAIFNQLTRDIQVAVSEAHVLPVIRTVPERIPKTNFSPYMIKGSLRPLPKSASNTPM